MRTIEQIKQDFDMVQCIEEISKASDIVSKLNPQFIMEIGVERGGSLQVWANCINPPGFIIGLDCQDIVDWNKFSTKNFLNFIQADSTDKEIVKEVYDYVEDINHDNNLEGLDFLFIDGDHSYGGVMEDFKNYSSLVRSGGIIGFHDINMTLDGSDNVTKFWREVKQSFKHEELVGSHGPIGIGLLYI